MAAPEVISALAEDRLAFFATLEEGFARACRQVEVVERHYVIAGCRFRLHFAGEALLGAIEPALAHLAVAGGAEADYELHLFDAASTATPLPFLAARLVDLLRLRWWELLDGRREIKGLHGDRIRAVFHLGPDILSVLDRQRRSAYYWVESAASIPYYEKGYPLSVLLNWCLAERRRHVVHAAAIGRADGGILLTGKGGSGKSTTTLACLDGGLSILGDDYAAVETDGAVAGSLYNTIKLKGPRDVERFSHLAACVSNLDRVDEGDAGERAVIFLHEHYPDRLLREMPVRAIFVPQVVDRADTVIRPVSPSVAFKALAPSTVFQLPGNAQSAFRALVEMVRRLPTYSIELGSDLARIPRAIEDFLDAV